MSKSVVVVEFGTSHTELFYSHFAILKEGNYKLYAFANKVLQDLLPKNFGAILEFFPQDLEKKEIVKQLLDFIKKHQIELVIFNTAHGKVVRQFVLKNLWNKKFEMVGVCHYIQKLNRSFSQALISLKISKYFILNNLFLENETLKPKKKSIAVFYPMFFNQLKNPPEIEKQADDIFISVPDGISQERRDYFGFFSELEKHKDNLAPNLKFLLLGHSMLDDGKKVKEIIKENNWENKFIIFQDFVNTADFYAYLKKTDLMFTLLHTQKPLSQVYLTEKISGSYNLAFGHQIPLLLSEDFASFEDFQDISFFYKISELIPLLNDLAKNPQKIQNKKDNYPKKEKLTFSYQAKNYLDFIES